MANGEKGSRNPFQTCKDISQKKSVLCTLSARMREMQAQIANDLASQGEDFVVPTINDLLLDSYKEMTGAREFRTFRNWAKIGKFPRKGQKAWVIWSKPRKAEAKLETTEGDEVKQEYEYWPVCFIFSNQQVH